MTATTKYDVLFLLGFLPYCALTWFVLGVAGHSYLRWIGPAGALLVVVMMVRCQILERKNARLRMLLLEYGYDKFVDPPDSPDEGLGGGGIEDGDDG